MTRFMTGNVFLLLSMICAASSQIMIKLLVDQIPSNELSWNAVRGFLTAARVMRGGFALLLLVSGFLFWLFSLTRLDLSYAYPIACSSVLLVALLSGIFLGEAVTLRMWSGTVLILIGIALLTPPR